MQKTGFNPGLERSPGEGNGTPLQYSCLENPMDRGAWWATVHRVTKSQIQPRQLSTLARTLHWHCLTWLCCFKETTHFLLPPLPLLSYSHAYPVQKSVLDQWDGVGRSDILVEINFFLKNCWMQTTSRQCKNTDNNGNIAWFELTFIQQTLVEHLCAHCFRHWKYKNE